MISGHPRGNSGGFIFFRVISAAIPVSPSNCEIVARSLSCSVEYDPAEMFSAIFTPVKLLMFSAIFTPVRLLMLAPARPALRSVGVVLNAGEARATSCL